MGSLLILGRQRIIHQSLLPNNSLTMRLELSAGQNLDVISKLLSEPHCDANNKPSTLTVAPYSYPP